MKRLKIIFFAVMVTVTMTVLPSCVEVVSGGFPKEIKMPKDGGEMTLHGNLEAGFFLAMDVSTYNGDMKEAEYVFPEDSGFSWDNLPSISELLRIKGLMLKCRHNWLTVYYFPNEMILKIEADPSSKKGSRRLYIRLLDYSNHKIEIKVKQ